jgi:hypothetical protein
MASERRSLAQAGVDSGDFGVMRLALVAVYFG